MTKNPKRILCEPFNRKVHEYLGLPIGYPILFCHTLKDVCWRKKYSLMVAVWATHQAIGIELHFYSSFVFVKPKSPLTINEKTCHLLCQKNVSFIENFSEKRKRNSSFVCLFAKAAAVTRQCQESRQANSSTISRRAGLCRLAQCITLDDSHCEC